MLCLYYGCIVCDYSFVRYLFPITLSKSLSTAIYVFKETLVIYFKWLEVSLLLFPTVAGNCWISFVPVSKPNAPLLHLPPEIHWRFKPCFTRYRLRVIVQSFPTTMDPRISSLNRKRPHMPHMPSRRMLGGPTVQIYSPTHPPSLSSNLLSPSHALSPKCALVFFNCICDVTLIIVLTC